MKPKGGAKCSRRSHSLWLKRLESRKRVRLARKSFWNQGDLEALTFTESGQVYMQEGGVRQGEAQEGHGQAGLGAGAESGPQRLEGTTSAASSILFRGPADPPSPLPWLL